MRKLFTIVTIFLILLTVNGFAKWQFVKNFPDDVTLTITDRGATLGAHGLAVDPDGKVWIQLYGTSDSVLKANGTKGPVRQIFCFYPDGTPAPWNGRKMVDIGGGVTDTLWNSQRGLGVDPDGNILWTAFDAIYKFDYKTCDVLLKLLPLPGFTLSAPAADAEGNIYASFVNPANPIKQFDKDGNFIGNVTESEPFYGRTLTVTSDGLTVLSPRFSGHAILAYTRPDMFSAFNMPPDTLFKGFDATSVYWNPATHKLWADCGTFFDMPNRFIGATTSYVPNTWYELDLANQTVTDSIRWNFNTADSPDERARAIAFSPDGNTAYVGCFGLATYPPIQMFQRVTGANVTFQADVSDMLTAGFTPGVDKLYVLGGFNNWVYDAAWATEADLINPTLYTVTGEVIGNVGDVFGWKFRGYPAENFADGGWEGGSNHEFTYTGGDIVLAAFKPAVVPAGKKLSQDVKVIFSVNCNGAKDFINKKPFPTVDGVYLNGDFALGTTSWAGWAVSNTTDNTLVKMFDDGTNSDAVAGDGIWTCEVVFATGSIPGHVYKYGIYSTAYTDTLNAGTNPMDNEAGYGVNHNLNISDASPVFVQPTDKFGSQWVKVERIPTDGTPSTFVLNQNYPNPFNPTTYINYDVAKKARVMLSVYNMRGQLIKTLVDGEQTPGTYRVDWNATDVQGVAVPSGVYFYRLESNGFSKTMKMTLMK